MSDETNTSLICFYILAARDKYSQNTKKYITIQINDIYILQYKKLSPLQSILKYPQYWLDINRILWSETSFTCVQISKESLSLSLSDTVSWYTYKYSSLNLDIWQKIPWKGGGWIVTKHRFRGNGVTAVDAESKSLP